MQTNLLVWAAVLVALPALAQPGGPSAVPTDANAVSAAPPYRSTFADYRAWREQELIDWRRANDEVGAVGGHMGYLRGQASPKAIPGAVPKPPAKAEAPK